MCFVVEINPLASHTVFACIFGGSEPKSIPPALFFLVSFFLLLSSTFLSPIALQREP